MSKVPIESVKELLKISEMTRRLTKIRTCGNRYVDVPISHICLNYNISHDDLIQRLMFIRSENLISFDNNYPIFNSTKNQINMTNFMLTNRYHKEYFKQTNWKIPRPILIEMLESYKFDQTINFDPFCQKYKILSSALKSEIYKLIKSEPTLDFIRNSRLINKSQFEFKFILKKKKLQIEEKNVNVNTNINTNIDSLINILFNESTIPPKRKDGKSYLIFSLVNNSQLIMDTIEELSQNIRTSISYNTKGEPYILFVI